MKYHYTPLRMAKIKTPPNAGKDEDLSYIAGENVKWCSNPRKLFDSF